MMCIELNKFNVHSSDGATALNPALQVALPDAVHRVEKFNVHSSDGATALVPVLQVELPDAVHRVEQVQRPCFGWSNSSHSCSPGKAS